MHCHHSLKTKIRKQNKNYTALNRLLYIVLILFVCSSCNDKESASRKSASKFNASNADTPDLAKESELEAFLREIDQKRPISSTDAERCLEATGNDSKSKSYCLIGWSMGSEKSAKIETYLLAHDFTLPAYTIAFLKTPRLIANLTIQEVERKLNLLQNYPSWMETYLINVWLGAHESISQGELNLFSARLLSKPDRSRYEVQEKTKIFLNRFPNLLPQYVSTYCKTDQMGDLQTRCWRFLAIASKAGLKLEPNWSLFLPNQKLDPQWQLFTQSFPLESSILSNLNH